MHPRFPALVGRKTTDGGGGGTVDPGLSPRPGLCLHACQPSDKHAERVIRWTQVLIPDPSAHPDVSVFGESISLYRAGLRFALFLPLGVAIPPAAFPPCGCRVRRCEPRCHSALSSRGDYLTNRTRVRKRYTVGTTCLAMSFCSRPGATDRQATPEPVT